MHVLGYSWRSMQPALIVNQENEVKYVPIGDRVDIRIGRQRTCIGRRIGPNRFEHLCTNRVDSRHIQCYECYIRDRFFPCLKCSGATCAADAEIAQICQQNEYVVYLALFGSTVKVGVSRFDRLTERLAEQGADLGAIVAKADGRMCRRIEAYIANMGFRSVMKTKDKIGCLFGPVEERILERAFNAITTKLKSRHIVGHFEPIEVVGDRIKPPPLQRIGAGMRIAGEVKGLKGELLFLNDLTINLKELIAWHVDLNAR